MHGNEKPTIVLLGWLLLAVPLAAQDHPAVERGFAADKVYQLADIDNVNVFNGATSIRIPISGTYPAGASLRYALNLVYTSKLWDFEEVLVGSSTYLVRSRPARHTTAGWGWTVSLGRLISPTDPSNETRRWQYLDPGLGRHGLYSTLHEVDTADTGVSYTRDSTYLRMKEVAGGNRTLELPDGQVHTFNAAGLLTRIEDRFGNYLEVTYGTSTWTLSDGQGRTHTVSFVQMVSDGATVMVVDKVELSAFGTATATYDFTYESKMVALACTDTFHSPTAKIEVPLLTRVDLPDGSSFVPSYYEVNCSYGLLKSLTLPTLGKIEYDWGFWYLPTEGCSDDYLLPWAAKTHGVKSRRFVDPSGTVLGSWQYLQSLLGPPADPTGLCTGESEDPSEVSVTRVTSPLGHYTDYYFSVWPNVVPAGGSPNGFQVEEYGLPFDRSQPDASGTRYLSSESYDCSSSPCTKKRSTYVRYEYERPCVANEAEICDESNRRLVSRRTVYHADSDRYADETFSGFDGLSHYRTAATAGSFPSGNVRTTFTNYNPGHDLTLNADYEVQSGYSMWKATDPWVLETFSEQTASEGSVTAKTQACFDATTGFLKRSRVLQGSAAGAADVIVAYTDADTDGNPDAEAYYGGDAQPVGTSSNLCGLALPSSAAYRKNHTYASGVLATSRYADPGTGAGLSFYNVDLTIDANTGLPSASRDVSGIETVLEYDALGRLTWEEPASGHGAWIEYQYTAATSAAAPAKVLVRRRANGSKTGAVLTEEEYQFDGFGRVAKERRQMPGLDWVARDTTYDAMSHVSTVSEWYDESASGTPAVTQFLGYDAFGRPTTIRPPDGASHDVTMSYTGDRVVQQTAKIATSRTAEVSVTRKERYDRQGRLYQVVEPSGPGGADVTTTYGYDVGSRLFTVSTTSGTVTQVRTFTYDRRGFLTSEVHPEKTGAVTYSGYDALGHAGRKVDGPSDLSFVYDDAERLTEIRETGGDVWKSFSYATANGTLDRRKGKLETATRYNRYDVLVATPPAPDEIFSNGFECGDSSGWDGTAPSCTIGTEVHYDVEVAETYTYGGKAGRVSQRNTAISVNGSTGESFTQGFTYTDLGDVASLSYPRCNFTRCTNDGGGFARTVSFSYTRGLLTAIAGYSSTIEYHPNGLLHRTYHDGAARLVQDLDANGMARPSEISAKLGTNTLWTTGSYSYDGGGNVWWMGGSSFVYDEVNRLTSAKVSLSQQGTGSLVEQGYTYDAFGNLTAISGTPGRTIPTNSTTNRLSGSVTYDNAGNQLSWNGNVYEYDPLHMMRRLTTPGGEDWLYVYTADDERVWMYDLAGGTSRYTLRDLSGQVLREYTVASDYWTRERDYIYSNGQLFAAETPQGLRHFYTDHLGTPRLVTDASGNQVAYHVYYPFGEEATSPIQDQERMKFTGHERDLADPTGTGDDLDYMIARHCSPLIGRFLTLDPTVGQKENPQSWNRYAYVRNNPLTFTDPTGREVRLSTIDEDERNLLIDQLREKTGLDLYYDEDSGNLLSRGELRNSEGEVMGSSVARGDLLDAINSSQVIWGIGRNASETVHMGQRVGPHIYLDFEDIAQIDSGNNDPATLDAGMIFLHELQHVQGRRDPPPGQVQRTPTIPGAAVSRMNRIRRELGLPSRGRFGFLRDNTGRPYLPFTNGPVYIPEPPQ